MNGLLASNFSRLFKNNLFYFFAVAILIICFLNNWDGYYTQKYLTGTLDLEILESYFYSSAPLFGGIQAALCAIFIGTDYSEGTIRNKFIVGHSRLDIYMANLITVSAASLIFIAIWYLSGVENLFLIYNAGNILRFLMFFTINIAYTLALSALFTAIDMAIDKLSLSIIINMVVWIVLLFVAIRISSELSIPEMSGGLAFVDGQFVMIEETPNEMYVGGTLRVIYNFILEVLPTGNALLVGDLNLEHPVSMLLYQIIIILVTTVSGISIFKNKNIK